MVPLFGVELGLVEGLRFWRLFLTGSATGGLYSCIAAFTADVSASANAVD